jgi:hypothetical protein
MEAPRSSRPSSPDGEEPEYDPKVRDVEMVDKTERIGEDKASNEQDKGESSTYQATISCPQDISGTNGIAGNGLDNDMEMILRKKIFECGLGEMRVPEMRMSGCSECEQTDSDDDEDDDICSTSSDDSDDPYNPLASGVMPPVLPDVQLRVPMENEDDVQRVKDALLIKGVLDVVCDLSRQIVTVTGMVPPSRLLKKLRKVNRQARIVSTVSPFAIFINPHFSSSSFALHEDDDATPHSNAIDIPLANPIPSSHHHRPRPTFQRYHFHNDPHSPYLRTFSFSDLSPPSNSPNFSPDYVTGDAFDHHRRFDSSFFHDDLVL